MSTPGIGPWPIAVLGNSKGRVGKAVLPFNRFMKLKGEVGSDAAAIPFLTPMRSARSSPMLRSGVRPAAAARICSIPIAKPRRMMEAACIVTSEVALAMIDVGEEINPLM